MRIAVIVLMAVACSTAEGATSMSTGIVAACDLTAACPNALQTSVATSVCGWPAHHDCQGAETRYTVASCYACSSPIVGTLYVEAIIEAGGACPEMQPLYATSYAKYCR